MGRLLHDRPFNALPEQQVALVAHNILTIMSELHKRGIAHRDLKPMNIMVNDHLDVKLIDFGSAFLSTSANNSMAFGTKGYLAPELIASKKSNSKPEKLDIWAIGTITHMLYFGALPELENSDSQTGLDQSMKQVWGSVPSTMKNFLERAMESSPENRATADELLVHPWLARA